MNILLWVLQVLLAIHTVMGAIWKFSNPAATAVPSLAAIPKPIWLGMSVVEILAAIALVIPLAVSSLGCWVPIASLFIAAEMLLFTAVHLASGEKVYSPVIYWSVVAVFCLFIAYGRWALLPL